MRVSIKNEMELAVRSEVERLRMPQSVMPALAGLGLDRFLKGISGLLGTSSGKRIACRCELCRTDVVALALTTLPPCYCRKLHYGISLERVDSDLIEKEVAKAVRKVELRPRHPSRGPVPEGNEVKLVDFGLREGGRIIGPLLQKLEGACSCNTCREDTLAYGLNRIGPRYGVEVVGKLRMPRHEVDFFRHEILPTLSEAASAIALNPRHGGKDRL